MKIDRIFHRDEKPLAWGLPASLGKWSDRYTQWVEADRLRPITFAGDHKSIEGLLWSLAAFYHGLATAPAEVNVVDADWSIERLIGGAKTTPWPVWHSWLERIELPLVQAVHLGCRERIDHAADAVAQWIDRAHDHGGWPHAMVAEEWPMVVAGIVRTTRLLKKLRRPLGEPAEHQTAEIPEPFIRLLRPDGSTIFGPRRGTPLSPAFKKRLAALSDDPDMAKLMRRCTKSARSPGRESVGFPEPSGRTEWGGIAVMQDAWHWGAPKLGLTFDGTQSKLELANQTTLLAGKWDPVIQIDGEAVEVETEFVEVCWHSDEDVDYLELEADLSDGSRLQRQALLIHGDQTVVLMDSIICDAARAIQYQVTLPVDDAISIQSETETTEHYFRCAATGEYLALAVPLSVNEWKLGQRENRFEVRDGNLTLAGECRGRRALTAAVAFDLSPERCVRPRTWRQLTVAQNLEPVGPDVAVAFRWQFEFQQWLVYRTQHVPANRTFMGVNVTADFYVGRFYANGRAEQLLQIEG